jgi:hypothetical protein
MIAGRRGRTPLRLDPDPFPGDPERINAIPWWPMARLAIDTPSPEAL